MSEKRGIVEGMEKLEAAKRERNKANAAFMAGLAQSGVHVIPSPMLQSGQMTLLVSQKEYDLMLAEIDMRGASPNADA